MNVCVWWEEAGESRENSHWHKENIQTPQKRGGNSNQEPSCYEAIMLTTTPICKPKHWFNIYKHFYCRTQLTATKNTTVGVALCKDLPQTFFSYDEIKQAPPEAWSQNRSVIKLQVLRWLLKACSKSESVPTEVYVKILYIFTACYKNTFGLWS